MTSSINKVMKKGQGLPLNTVIIAILVVLVLIVLVIFFLTGTGGLTKTVRDIFYKTTVGTDKGIAIQTCQKFCNDAKQVSDVENSAYCTVTYNIDWDNDGEIDPDGGNPPATKVYRCYQPPLRGNFQCDIPAESCKK